MKKAALVGIAITLSMSLFAVVMSGCGSSSPSTATSTGQTTGANQTTYNVPTEAEIGIPFYPGAVVNTQRTIKDHSVNKTAAATWDMVDLEVTGESIAEATNWYQKQLASKPNFDSVLAASEGDGSRFDYDEGGYHKMVEIFDFSQTPDKDGFTGIEIDLTRYPASASSGK